jgi:sugar-specific transcriptional regulator TrmB
METKNILENFHRFGLNTYEARAYLALLEKSSLMATKVASIARLPRARVYDILENLMAKGLCVEIPGKYKSYCATSPADLKDKLLPKTEQSIEKEIKDLNENYQKLESELKEKQKKLVLEFEEKRKKLALKKKKAISEANTLSRYLIPIYEKGRVNKSPLDYIEIIRDMGLAAKRFLEISGKVEYEALHFVKGPFTGDRDALLKQVEIQCQRAKRKHVRARVLYEIKNKDDEWIYEFIEAAAAGGDEDARILTHLPLKGAVIDEKIIIISMPDPINRRTSFTTMIIEHPDLASTLKITFEALWAKAKDYRAWKSRKSKGGDKS